MYRDKSSVVLIWKSWHRLFLMVITFFNCKSVWKCLQFKKFELHPIPEYLYPVKLLNVGKLLLMCHTLWNVEIRLERNLLLLRNIKKPFATWHISLIWRKPMNVTKLHWVLENLYLKKLWNWYDKVLSQTYLFLYIWKVLNR